jgi:hypothetical protein
MVRVQLVLQVWPVLLKQLGPQEVCAQELLLPTLEVQALLVQLEEQELLAPRPLEKQVPLEVLVLLVQLEKQGPLEVPALLVQREEQEPLVPLEKQVPLEVPALLVPPGKQVLLAPPEVPALRVQLEVQGLLVLREELALPEPQVLIQLGLE